MFKNEQISKQTKIDQKGQGYLASGLSSLKVFLTIPVQQ